MKKTLGEKRTKLPLKWEKNNFWTHKITVYLFTDLFELSWLQPSLLMAHQFRLKVPNPYKSFWNWVYCFGTISKIAKLQITER